MKADTFKLARDLVRGKWLMAYPERFLPVARAFLSKTPVEMDVTASECSEVLAAVSGKGARNSSQKKVAIVPLHGAMTKYDNCGSYGTAQLASKVKEYADKSDVAGIILDIDSPGGSSAAVPPLLEAISYARGKGKPVYAHVDMCGSAAFWVASQCDAIYMDNRMSEIGSVGCYAVFYDTSAPSPLTGTREITVYSRKSGDKNLAYRKALEGDLEPARDELDEVAALFQEAVKTGRPGMKADEPGVLTGKMFPASEAISLGMADAIATLDETVEVVFALSEIK
jgi:protease-4